MKKITSLKQLLDELPHCSGKEYVQLAQRMEIPVEDFMPYAFWSEDTYTRNCIDRADDYELLLLCWEDGLETPIHCHGGEECWVYTLKGKIKEYRQDINDETCKLEVLNEENMSAGNISYMNDNMGFHSLHNVANGRSMTLHLYMNPIDRCRVYNEEEDKFEYTELEYHTYKGKPVSKEMVLNN